MGAETTGRKLGIGLRLAAKAVKRGAAAAVASTSQPANSASPAQSNYGQKPTLAATAAAGQAKTKAADIAKGAKRFGEAVWGPMAHTGGVLWLEITGLFFALFAIFFAQNVYKFRGAYKGGPDHVHFLIYAALAVLFAAFTLTQFYKARQKERKNRARLSSTVR